MVLFKGREERRMYEFIRELLKKDPCPECVYYHEENNTCQSKKVSTGGDGYVTLIDRVLCEPHKGERKEE